MSEFATCPDCDEKVKLKPGRSSLKCPACGASVKASAAADKTARRSKDDEGDDREERKKPKRKYRKDWDDDDDGDDRRQAPAKQGGSLTWLWVLLGVLALVIAGCVGAYFWFVSVVVNKTRDNIVNVRDEMKADLDAKMNRGFDTNRPGKGWAPAQPDAGTYPKAKPYEADPALAAGNSVFLDTLTPYEVTQGDWKFARGGAMGDPQNSWVVVDGKFYDHSIAMHPPHNGTARAKFAVGGQVRTIGGWVGLNDVHGNSAAWDNVSFAIYKDNKEVWRCPPFKNRTGPVAFSVDVTGARVIMLETKAHGNAHNAHCVWLDPTLSK